MARIKISNLGVSTPLVDPIGQEEELIRATQDAVLRALDARQLQDIRGGLSIPPVLTGRITPHPDPS